MEMSQLLSSIFVSSLAVLATFPAAFKIKYSVSCCITRIVNVESAKCSK